MTRKDATEAKPGDLVKDKITERPGAAIAEINWLTRCKEIGVVFLGSNGETVWIEAGRLEVMEPGIYKASDLLPKPKPIARHEGSAG